MDGMDGGGDSATICKKHDSSKLEVGNAIECIVIFQTESVKVDIKNVCFKDFDSWIRQRFGICESSKVRYLNAQGDGR